MEDEERGRSRGRRSLQRAELISRVQKLLFQVKPITCFLILMTQVANQKPKNLTSDLELLMVWCDLLYQVGPQKECMNMNLELMFFKMSVQDSKRRSNLRSAACKAQRVKADLIKLVKSLGKSRN